MNLKDLLPSGQIEIPIRFVTLDLKKNNSSKLSDERETASAPGYQQKTSTEEIQNVQQADNPFVSGGDS